MYPWNWSGGSINLYRILGTPKGAHFTIFTRRNEPMSLDILPLSKVLKIGRRQTVTFFRSLNYLWVWPLLNFVTLLLLKISNEVVLFSKPTMWPDHIICQSFSIIFRYKWGRNHVNILWWLFESTCCHFLNWTIWKLVFNCLSLL